jgi:cysteine synthase A
MTLLAQREWQHEAIAILGREAARSADTHLLRMELPGFPGIDLYLKDEAAHPTGSLKHRLARSLFLYALCNGRITPGQTVIDASSGSTAISEAWFARLLDLPFVAVMPEGTAPAKVAAVLALGGRCELVPAGDDCAAHATQRAEREGLCYLDQFGLAERATDWRGNNNIAESILAQMAREPHPVPHWIVCGAGTGGTSATIGRYLRYRGADTRLCVAEPSGGAFAEGWRRMDRSATASRATCIEGIGRPRVEPGFLFDVVDAVEEVDDRDSIAAAWLLERRLDRRYGGSSGSNFVACLRLAEAMREAGQRGSIVSLLCDRGERYQDSLFDPAWLQRHGLHPGARLAALQAWVDQGIAHPDLATAA